MFKIFEFSLAVYYEYVAFAAPHSAPSQPFSSLGFIKALHDPPKQENLKRRAPQFLPNIVPSFFIASSFCTLVYIATSHPLSPRVCSIQQRRSRARPTLSTKSVGYRNARVFAG